MKQILTYILISQHAEFLQSCRIIPYIKEYLLIFVRELRKDGIIL